MRCFVSVKMLTTQLKSQNVFNEGTGVRTPKYRSLYKGPRYLFRKFQFMFLSNLEVNQLIYLSSRSLDCEKNDSRAQKIMRKNTIF